MFLLRSWVNRPWVILLLATIMCHTILVFTDYIAYDDLWLTNWLQTRQFDSLHEFFSQSGTLLSYRYFVAAAYIPKMIFVFKVVGFLTMFLNGILAFHIARKSGFLSRPECLIIGTVAICLPAFKMNGGVVYSAYEVTLTSFLAATLLWIHAESWPVRKAAAARILCLGLFVFSFIMPSLLMFYGGFMLLVVLMHQRNHGLSWYQIPLGYCMRRLDFIFLPIAYWYLKQTLTPTYGPYYGNYNKIGATPEQILDGYKTLWTVLEDPFNLIMTLELPKQMAIAGVAFSLTAAIYWLRQPADRSDDHSISKSYASAAAIVCYGLLLLTFGTLPYLFVTKYFAAFGVRSAYTPLVPISIGVMLAGLYRFAASTAPSILKAAPIAISACLAVWATAWVHNYLSMEEVQIRNFALVRQVHSHPFARDANIYHVDNRAVVPRTIDETHIWCWTYIDCGPTGTPRSVAFNGLPGGAINPVQEVENFIRISTFDYALTSIDPAGRQGIIVVKPGRRPLTPQESLRYIYLKRLRPEKLEGFFDSLVSIDYYPAPYSPDDLARARLR